MGTKVSGNAERVGDSALLEGLARVGLVLDQVCRRVNRWV